MNTNCKRKAAIVTMFFLLFGLISCEKKEAKIDPPTVHTLEVAEVASYTAVCRGEVTEDGGADVTNRGVCWSENQDPTMDDNHAVSGEGIGEFSCDIIGLEANTTYFVRAYATNSKGIAYGEELCFTTNPLPYYTVGVSAFPSYGGTVEGGDEYEEGQLCTVVAIANEGYSFNHWMENGNIVSTDASYSFNVTGNCTLVAHFAVQRHAITLSASPSNGGAVYGTGSYNHGASCTVRAIANTGFDFINWTEDGNVVSTDASYSFSVTGNRTLVAHFAVQSYTISLDMDPFDAGRVSGDGTYSYGQCCVLTAIPNTHYIFEKWTKNGSQVSTNAAYAFNVTESALYVAHFKRRSL